jgi:hypothetical protein
MAARSYTSARPGRNIEVGVVSRVATLFLVPGLVAWATDPSTNSVRGLVVSVVVILRGYAYDVL